MNKTYAFTDLHGMYPLWEQIKNFCDETDRLIFLGDACDRGDDGLKIIKELLLDKRVTYIKGNHEDFLEDIGAEVADERYGSTPLWRMNGGFQTLQDFEKLSDSSKLWYIRQMSKLATVVEYTNTKGQKILLSHAGFTPTLEPLETEVENYWWDREHIWSDWWPGADESDTEDVNKKEDYEHVYVVHGHTPVQSLRPKLQMVRHEFTQDGIIGPITYCQGHKIDLDVASFDTGCIILFDLDEMKVAQKFYCEIEGVE